MDKIKRLQEYVNKVNMSIKQSTGAKKEFFQRELKKTELKLKQLRGV